MSQTVATIATTAASVALVHTLIGVDHYLPFIALSRAGGWTLRKTLFWTGLCGLGHVLSSIVLALLASSLGWAIGNVRAIDGVRGDLAAYLLLAFGIGYALWGLRRTHHAHAHVHGEAHEHHHDDAKGLAQAHAHVHEQEEAAAKEGSSATQATDARRKMTLWALFVIFVLGPCEPLIPLMVAPALTHDLTAAAAVVALFSLITIGTMLVMVTLGHFGFGLLKLSALERWAHPLAGAAIAISGGLILLGL